MLLKRRINNFGIDMQKNISSKLKNLDLEDKIMLGLLLVIFVFLFYLVSNFKHIPGPVYGGDLYMIRGFTQAIIQGHPPWEDPLFEGNYAYYGWLSYLGTAFLVKLTGIGLEKMSTMLPAFMHILILFVCYKFGTAFFKSKRYGLIFMVAFFSLRIIDTKLSAGFATLFMMLTLWSWIEYEQGNKKYKYLMGLFWGLTALSHVNYFIVLSAMIGVSIFLQHVRGFKGGSKKVIVKFVRKYLPVFIIALLITLLLVGPWLFVYHMKTLNQTQQYSMQDIRTAGVGWIFKIVWETFVRTNGIIPFVWGMIVVLGLMFCLLNRKKLEQSYALYWLLSSILVASHHLITRPLFNNWIVPGLLWGNSIWIVSLVLFTYGLKNIELMLGKFGLSRDLLLVVFLVFLTLVSFQSFNNFNNDRWVQYGRILDSSLNLLFETERWIIANTDKDDIFLANDESAFALNALSGRRLVIARRTHANYYVDVEKRYADAIVMLYGNNKVKTLELLNEYSVDYLYVDSFLIQYPLLTSLEHEQFLTENGVNFSIQEVRLDPSTMNAPTFESIVVPPQDLMILEHNLTTVEKQFLINGQLHSMFYKINI